MTSAIHELEFPAEPSALKDVRRFFRPLAERYGGEHAEQLILAVDESCSNAIKHRHEAIGGGKIRLRVERRAGALRITLESFCRDTDVKRIRPRALEDIRPGGLGTHIVREVMDRVSFTPHPAEPGTMTLVLEKDLPSEEGA